MRPAEYAFAAMVLLSFAIGIWLYPSMPEPMAGHWDAAGQVDGYLPRFWGLFLMPVITAGMLLLYLAIPRMDPLKRNLEKFRGHYDLFMLLLAGFLLYLYMLTLAWSLGFMFDMVMMLVPAFAMLFYYAGVLVEHSRKNWFIGIRTPWTMSSDRVWGKTHKLGGRLFKVAAVVALLGLLFRDWAIWIMIVPVMAVAIYTVAYSYFEYRKEAR